MFILGLLCGGVLGIALGGAAAYIYFHEVKKAQ